MRRSEFWDEMSDSDDLYDFASSMGLSIADELISSENFDDKVCSAINEATSHLMWDEIRNKLNDIDDSYGNDYYVGGDGWLEYIPMSFEEIAERVMEEMDYGELWDDEEGDEEDEEEDECVEEDEEDLEEETCGFLLDEFADSIRDETVSIRERLAKEEAAQREEEARRVAEAKQIIADENARATQEERERAAMIGGLLSIAS